MEIGATKAVQDRLKTTKIEESAGASLVFCWDTHLTKIKRRNVLFIVNASNRYTIAMTDIEPRNWKRHCPEEYGFAAVMQRNLCEREIRLYRWLRQPACCIIQTKLRMRIIHRKK